MGIVSFLAYEVMTALKYLTFSFHLESISRVTKHIYQNLATNFDYKVIFGFLEMQIEFLRTGPAISIPKYPGLTPNLGLVINRIIINRMIQLFKNKCQRG